MAGVRTVKVEWTKDPNGRWKMDEVEGSEKVREGAYHIYIKGKLGNGDNETK